MIELASDQQYADIVSHAFNEQNQYSDALIPLLKALHWRGNTRVLFDALPYICEHLELSGLIHILDLLGYQVTSMRQDANDIHDSLLPAFFQTRDEQLYVLDSIDGQPRALDVNRHCYLDDLSAIPEGAAYCIKKKEKKNAPATGNWFINCLKQFKGFFIGLVAISLVSNLLLLCVPFFILNVYDGVIRLASQPMLAGLAIGVVLAMTGVFLLRKIQAQMLAYLSSRLDMLVGYRLVEKILYLPASMTNRVAVNAQIARIKDFDTVREFLTGSIIRLLIDIPFFLVYLSVIAFFGFNLALITAAAAVLFVISAFLIQPTLQAGIREQATQRSRYQRFISEMLTYMRTVKLSDNQDSWLKQQRTILADSAIANYRVKLLNQLVTNLSSLLMMLTGIAIILAGVVSVFNETLSVGSLIAVMILVWRTIAPFKMVFLVIARFEQFKRGVKQINNLMDLDVEQNKASYYPLTEGFNGRVRFREVSLQGPFDNAIRLRQVSFELEPGQIVAIVDPHGPSGQAIFDVLLCLVTPQDGLVTMDDKNIMHIAVAELRERIAYIPDEPQFFYGTILQNFRLVRPDVSEQQVTSLMDLLGLSQDIAALDYGLETQLRDYYHYKIPLLLLYKLNVARALLKGARVLLVSDLSNKLDEHNYQLFMQILQQLKGQVTVLVLTSKNDLLSLADQQLVFNDARLT